MTFWIFGKKGDRGKDIIDDRLRTEEEAERRQNANQKK